MPPCINGVNPYNRKNNAPENAKTAEFQHIELTKLMIWVAYQLHNADHIAPTTMKIDTRQKSVESDH